MTSLLATLLANPHDPDIRLIYAGAVEDGKCELPAVDLRGGKVVHDQYGVPLRVKATMVTWCGESCFACQSTGRLNVVLRLGDGFTSVPCSKCNGTGRILGIAAAVCGAWPITAVELTDREPLNETIRFAWYSRVRSDYRNTIESPLWDLLAGFIKYGDDNPYLLKWYPTRDFAIAALSHAALTLGRRAAGLPDIQFINHK